VLKEARQALADSRKIEAEKLQAPLETLNYQRQLLDLIRQLEAIHAELSQAAPRLASLMNLEPGKPLTLVVPPQLTTPQIHMPLDKMEETALLQRPELMEARYNERIGVAETRKAMARLLPGVEFSIGAHYDSNSFLVNNDWRDFGLRVSWNLMNLLNASKIRGAAEAQQEIATHQRLAVSMAVLTQTHVAYYDYIGRLRQYELNDEADDVEQRILVHTRHATQSNAQGKMLEIRAATSALMSELRRYQSYGALQGAYGQMLATLGMDGLPPTLDSHDLTAVRKAVSDMEAGWSQALEGKR
jgi:outer membrane protein TolC